MKYSILLTIISGIIFWLIGELIIFQSPLNANACAFSGFAFLLFVIFITYGICCDLKYSRKGEK